MKFVYTARTKEGELIKGEIEASTREIALRLLQDSDLIITSLQEEKRGFLEREIDFFDKPSSKDIILFTKQLATLLRSNISLVEALSSIGKETTKKSMSRLILKLAQRVEEGQRFSEAISEFPQYFSGFYLGVVRAGEASGTLPESLEYLAQYLEKEKRLVSKFISAMIYPTMLFTVFLLVLVFISIFLIPKFEQLFQQSNIEPPFITQLLFGTANLVRRFWWVLALSPFLGFGIFKYLTSTQEGEKRWHLFLLSLPLVGELFKKFYLTRLSLTFSTMIKSGVPILKSLEITKGIVGNRVYEEILDKAIQGVRRGEKLSSIFSLYPEFFPPLFLQMLNTGEKTGKIEDTLQTVVQFYSEETERLMNTATRFLEPVIVIFIAFLVLGVAIGIFLPLFQSTMSI